MRGLGVSAALALSLVVGGTVTVGAVAVDGDVPSQREVREARSAARAAADDVAGVQARLAAADRRLEESAVRAAQAAEAFNGARWEAREARRAAIQARQDAAAADLDLERQREAYADTLVDSYELAPGLTALAAVVQSQGIETVIDRTTTLSNAEQAMDRQYDDFRAALTRAEVAKSQAESASAAAERARRDAHAAKVRAEQAADEAAAEAEAIAAERAALLARVAELEQISVDLAERRQAALERRAAREARIEARKEARRAAEEERERDTHTRNGCSEASETTTSCVGNEPESTPEPETSEASDEPDQTDATPPAPAKGAAAAIAFARAQLGEPYRWGAAGPGAWDCSGLTMGAWSVGGKSLPHYSVAQYQQSTPIRASELRPGDLVFWGSNSSPGSIYHVALYVGDGRIIHAPRTGRPVTEESMYSWTAPTFFARP